jgi:hypothetical protein
MTPSPSKKLSCTTFSYHISDIAWLGLCLTPLSTIFQLYPAVCFIGGVPVETADLP